MPTSINISRYPAGMMDLIEAICETRHPAVIAYESTAKAKTERLRFYGLIRALQISGHSVAEDAGRLVLTLSGGRSQKDHNTLTIGFPAETATSALYSAVAAGLTGSSSTLDSLLDPKPPVDPAGITTAEADK